MSLEQIKWLPAFYLLSINIWAFVVFGWDKLAAKRGVSRVSERCLWGVMGVGGVVGAWLAMRYFRHKTQKVAFRKRAFWAGLLGGVVIAGIFALQVFVGGW